jgi:hypothetical protein
MAEISEEVIDIAYAAVNALSEVSDSDSARDMANGVVFFLGYLAMAGVQEEDSDVSIGDIIEAGMKVMGA